MIEPRLPASCSSGGRLWKRKDGTVRVKLIAANWKMHKTHEEAARDAQKIREALGELPPSLEVTMIPAFPALAAVSSALAGSKMTLGAQNVHPEPQGAFTGEVSAPMLKSCGCRFVIVGHSERRQFFSETDEEIGKKLLAIFREGMHPILCVGESETERNKSQTFKVLDKQVREAVKGLSVSEAGKMVLAYEPVWAIGTGNSASVEQIQEVHAFLRRLLLDLFDKDLASQVRILYGGSVKPDNIRVFMNLENVDGALVGGASLEPESFVSLVRNGISA